MTSMFRLQIETENAAFEPSPRLEVARILRELAERLEQGLFGGRRLHDINGNNVGSFRFVSPRIAGSRGDEV